MLDHIFLDQQINEKYLVKRGKHFCWGVQVFLRFFLVDGFSSIFQRFQILVGNVGSKYHDQSPIFTPLAHGIYVQKTSLLLPRNRDGQLFKELKRRERLEKNTKHLPGIIVFSFHFFITVLGPPGPPYEHNEFFFFFFVMSIKIV